MSSLDNIILHRNVRWIDELEYAPVSQEIELTIGGGSVIWIMPRGARPITLFRGENEAWLKWADLAAFRKRADELGVVMQLYWEGKIYQTIFAHHTPPAIDMQKVENRISNDENHWFGEIKLMEV